MSSLEANGPPEETPPLLDVDGLRKAYRLRGGRQAKHGGEVVAVDDVSFRVAQGATFGVVGESGSGKTTLGNLVLGLETPSAGTVRLSGQDVYQLRGKAHRQWRQQAQVIFQNPYGALAPRMRVLDAVEEPLAIQGQGDRSTRRRQALEILEAVGLTSAHAQRYPHELSGGQRQRVVIARAIVLRPKLVVCDEPTSALDVSVQAQVLALLRDLQSRLHLTYLFISHDLGVVRNMASELVVMYLGSIVEHGRTEEVFRHPLHPYTHALLAAIPSVRSRAKSWAQVPSGESKNTPAAVEGCRFCDRCPIATARCAVEAPQLRWVKGHMAACHHAEAKTDPGSASGGAPENSDDAARPFSTANHGERK